jgi:hypothetical protein
MPELQASISISTAKKQPPEKGLERIHRRKADARSACKET